jgi:predicted ATP-dependent endonuclease of OLD family
MATKMLSSFEISGFRAFDHLKLTNLGRVNLFVGKNNVGKSSLLEAFWVYANQGAPSVLWSLLVDRNESESLSELRLADRLTDEEIEKQFLTIRYLFYGREENPEAQAISLGPVENGSKTLTIAYMSSAGQGKNNNQVLRFSNEEDEDEKVPALSIKMGNTTTLIRMDRFFTKRMREPLRLSSESKNIFIPANGLSNADVGRYWDSITLGAAEKDVLDSLRIIDPRIERLNLVGSLRDTSDRVPIVKISDFDQPLPLRSLGEGMNRIFGIALALVNARGGILLMDKIESGLHYSILPNVWDFIFQAARRLDVQVFASTHSKDCIDGFQQAASKSNEQGVLIRLENKNGRIVPVSFDEKELNIVTRDQIEVR